MKKNNDINRSGMLLPEFLASLLIVTIIITNGHQASGQQYNAVDVTARGLQIGQQVPDVAISNIHNYKTKTAKISDFKGKVLILDFCATWCGACLSMLPKMDSLQKEFDNKIQFLSVTYQQENEVVPFFQRFEKQNNIHSSIPIATSDRNLSTLFPHRTLPHYVWIDQEGKVLSMTGSEEINAERISDVITGKSKSVPKKTDFVIDYDYKRPLFLNTAIANLIKTQSIITDYMEGLGPVNSHNIFSSDTLERKRITATNMSIARLYQIAMGKGTRKFTWARTILEVKDTTRLSNSTSGTLYKNWLKAGNGFCYELILPKKFDDAFVIMENDLRDYFTAYNATIETRPLEVLVLKKLSSSDRLKTKGGSPYMKINSIGGTLVNKPLSIINTYISTYIKTVLDETGIVGNIDLRIDADMSNIASINKEMIKYGLKYVIEKRDVEFLVIRDRLNNSNSKPTPKI